MPWLLILSALLLAVPRAAPAQNWPTETIHIVAPFPPGGTTDLLARELAPRMAAALGVTVLVDNRVGASAMIGTDYVARSRPDGTRLLMAGSPHGINNSIRRNVPYDPVRDFEPVAMLVVLPQVLVVHPSLPAADINAFMALARSRPDAIRCGITSASSSHLAVEMLNMMSGLRLAQIPYRGDAQTINDLVGGHVNCFIGIANQILPFVREGRMRAIAVTSRQRIEALPETPTLVEFGLPEYEVASWNGIFAPAGTPAAIRDRLAAVLVAATEEESFRRRWTGIGAIVAGGGPDALRRHLAGEIARWRPVIEAAGLREE